MERMTRRGLIRAGAAGLVVMGSGGRLLKAGAEPTPESGDLGRYPEYLGSREGTVFDGAERSGGAPAKWAVTEDNILGPYYRSGAPFRAKVTPPLEPGTALLIRGRVYGIDTRKPLPGVTIDIWQADADGRYDNEPDMAPAVNFFRCRARLVTDESGYYEYETVHPGRYQIGRDTWRPAHIHYVVRHRTYKQLITQLYFKGDPENARDQFIKKSLIIELDTIKTRNGAYESGTFDIVLEPA